MNGYVKLRRGIAQHVADGKLPTDEFAAYLMMILEADHANGLWFGNGILLSKIMRWQPRKAQRVLASLKALGYVEYDASKGFGGWQFHVKINKYFSSPSDDSIASPVTGHHVTTDAMTDSSRHHRRDIEVIASPVTRERHERVTGDAMTVATATNETTSEPLRREVRKELRKETENLSSLPDKTESQTQNLKARLLRKAREVQSSCQRILSNPHLPPNDKKKCEEKLREIDAEILELTR